MKKAFVIAPVLLGLGLWFMFPPAGDRELTPALVNPSGTPKAKPAQESVPAAKETESPEVQPLRTNDPSKIAQSHAMNPHLELYTQLSRKALRTDTENSRRHDLVRDEALVRELGELLQTEYLNDEEKQFAALDFVFEALEAGSTEAQKQLQKIVSDDFIENPKNDFSERQAAAELKAEVLYRWLASAPELESQMRDSLPGSVSKKLWDNVKRAHESNELESDRSS